MCAKNCGGMILFILLVNSLSFQSQQHVAGTAASAII